MMQSTYTNGSTIYSNVDQNNNNNNNNHIKHEQSDSLSIKPNNSNTIPDNINKTSDLHSLSSQQQQQQQQQIFSNMTQAQLIKRQQLEAIKLIKISIDKLTHQSSFSISNNKNDSNNKKASNPSSTVTEANLHRNLLVSNILNKAKYFYYQSIVQMMELSMPKVNGNYQSFIQEMNTNNSLCNNNINQTTINNNDSTMNKRKKKSPNNNNNNNKKSESLSTTIKSTPKQPKISVKKLKDLTTSPQFNLKDNLVFKNSENLTPKTPKNKSQPKQTCNKNNNSNNNNHKNKKSYVFKCSKLSTLKSPSSLIAITVNNDSSCLTS
jgi:hypothetical protein